MKKKRLKSIYIKHRRGIFSVVNHKAIGKKNYNNKNL